MPIIFNGKTNPTQVVYTDTNNIDYNLERVVYNGDLVWQKTPTIKTVTPDIITPNYEDITENSVTWYVRNDDSITTTIYSRLSNEAVYTSVASVDPGANATFSRTGLLDKHTYTIQAYATASGRLTSDEAIEEQFTTKAIYYRVNWYDGYDAAPYFSQEIEKGNSVNDIGSPPVPAELGVGYEFDYWSVGGIQASFPYTINSNTNFLANWKVVNYTVLWKDWDSSILKTQIVGSNYHLTTTDQPAASRTGWTFTGWNLSLPRYITSDTILIAQYSINSYTLRWYDSDGIVMKTQSVQYGDSVTTADQPYPLPTKEGYTFTGWSQSLPFYMPATNINMYPLYTANTYIIRWLNWDGSVLKTQNLQSGYQITTSDAPSNPSRTGYTFTGWSPTLPRYVISSNIDFTAQFTINSYAVKWYDGAGAVLWSGNLNYGTYIDSAYIDPGTVSCKYFTGWDPSLPHTITGAVNFIPQYSYYYYTVTWNDGYGSDLKTKSYQCGTTCPSSDYPAAPTRTGYTFDGWSKAGDFAVYQNWTIYATWRANTYYVRWYGYDGTEITSHPYLYGETCLTTDWPANPTYACEIFSSWSRSKVNFTVTGNVNITSIWVDATPAVPTALSGVPGTNQITFNYTKGSCSPSVTIEYKITTATIWTTFSTTNASQYIKTGIPKGTYNIRIKAVNGTASSAYRTGSNVTVSSGSY